MLVLFNSFLESVTVKESSDQIEEHVQLYESDEKPRQGIIFTAGMDENACTDVDVEKVKSTFEHTVLEKTNDELGYQKLSTVTNAGNKVIIRSKSVVKLYSCMFYIIMPIIETAKDPDANIHEAGIVSSK